MFKESAKVVGCSVFEKEKNGKKQKYYIAQCVVQDAFISMKGESFGDKVLSVFVSELPTLGDTLLVTQVYDRNGNKRYSVI